MNTFIWNIAAGVLRHILGYAGAALVTAGYLTDADSAQAIGALMGLASLAWMALSKKHAETRVETAQVSALMTPVPSPQKLQVAADRIADARGHDETTADDLNRAQLDIIRERRS